MDQNTLFTQQKQTFGKQHQSKVLDHLQVINDSLNSEHPSQVYGNHSCFYPDESAQQSLKSVSQVEIQPPAILLGEGCPGGEWDSSMETDQSLEQLDRTALQHVVEKFTREVEGIEDTNQKILFRQFFAIQHKVSAEMLEREM